METLPFPLLEKIAASLVRRSQLVTETLEIHQQLPRGLLSLAATSRRLRAAASANCSDLQWRKTCSQTEFEVWVRLAGTSLRKLSITFGVGYIGHTFAARIFSTLRDAPAPLQQLDLSGISLQSLAQVNALKDLFTLIRGSLVELELPRPRDRAADLGYVCVFSKLTKLRSFSVEVDQHLMAILHLICISFRESSSSLDASGLDELRLYFDDNVSAAVFQHLPLLTQACGGVKSLSMRGLASFIAQIPSSLVTTFNGIRILTLQNITINLSFLQSIVRGCPLLDDLRIQRCSLYGNNPIPGDLGVQEFAFIVQAAGETLTAMSWVDFVVDGADIDVISSSCKNLKHVALKLADGAVNSLPGMCSSLRDSLISVQIYNTGPPFDASERQTLLQSLHNTSRLQSIVLEQISLSEDELRSIMRHTGRALTFFRTWFSSDIPPVAMIRAVADILEYAAINNAGLRHIEAVTLSDDRVPASSALGRRLTEAVRRLFQIAPLLNEDCIMALLRQFLIDAPTINALATSVNVQTG